MPCRFNFRNPSFGWRVFLVAVVLAVPGALAGMMVSLLLGEFLICSLVGALAGAVLAVGMEARTPPGVQEDLDSCERSESWEHFCPHD